jgi:LAO/AO transport system kinase
VLVLTPAGGDGVQAFKAGIMEIADLIVINKADLPGADRLEREIQAALELAPHDEHTWWPPVLQTIAAKGQGLSEIVAGIDAHRHHLEHHLEHHGLDTRRARRDRYEVERALAERIETMVAQADAHTLERVALGEWPLEALWEGKTAHGLS